MKKENFIILGIAFIPIVIIGIHFFTMISGAIFLFNENPPKPEITYGEFKFKITYTINDEMKVVEDVVICEFDGFENLGSAGNERKWKSRLKSGKDKLVLLHNKTSTTEFLIYSSYGIPDYYMGDLGYISNEEHEKMMSVDKDLGYIECKNGVQTGTTITAQEAFEKYKIKIISINYDKPIHNSFR